MSEEPQRAGTTRITVTENGPYMVEGPVRISNALGEDVTGKPQVWLCRCGQSQNKPFCDGSHSRVGFDGTEVADRAPMAERHVAYEGEGITIFDDRRRCAHAGECTDGLPSVWKLREEPWIEATAAPAEQIAAVVRRCPSGALTYATPEAEGTVEEEAEPSLAAAKDGPYRVRAVEVVSEGGEPYEARTRQTLCRCGQSRNKPFCDGSHWKAEFKDPA